MSHYINRTWIADDHQLVLDGFHILLSMRDDIEIIGESNDGVQLIHALQTQKIDLVISDLIMPNMDGLELMRTIKKAHPEVKLLVVSMSDELEIIYQLFIAETDGYILKNSGKQELFAAIDDILNDKIHYPSQLLGQIIQRQKQEKNMWKNAILSRRELEVLNLIMAEKTSIEIANALFISKQTVDTHRKHIYEKTEVNTLVGLIKYALRLNSMPI
jgi:DNA-binding NarL/FixJ family response regulator